MGKEKRGLNQDCCMDSSFKVHSEMTLSYSLLQPFFLILLMLNKKTERASGSSYLTNQTFFHPCCFSPEQFYKRGP